MAKRFPDTYDKHKQRKHHTPTIRIEPYAATGPSMGLIDRHIVRWALGFFSTDIAILTRLYR